jgi:hypothetical protein
MSTSKTDPRETDQSIKTRQREIFVTQSAAPEAGLVPYKSFRDHLRDTSAAPLSFGLKAALCGAGMVVTVLMSAALLHASHSSRGENLHYHPSDVIAPTPPGGTTPPVVKSETPPPPGETKKPTPPPEAPAKSEPKPAAPTPAPTPTPQPAPQPAPTPQPAPQPAPTPQPAPQPEVRPTPTATPQPAPKVEEVRKQRGRSRIPKRLEGVIDQPKKLFGEDEENP